MRKIFMVVVAVCVVAGITVGCGVSKKRVESIGALEEIFVDDRQYETYEEIIEDVGEIGIDADKVEINGEDYGVEVYEGTSKLNIDITDKGTQYEYNIVDAPEESDNIRAYTITKEDEETYEVEITSFDIDDPDDGEITYHQTAEEAVEYVIEEANKVRETE